MDLSCNNYGFDELFARCIEELVELYGDYDLIKWHLENIIDGNTNLYTIFLKIASLYLETYRDNHPIPKKYSYY